MTNLHKKSYFFLNKVKLHTKIITADSNDTEISDAAEKADFILSFGPGLTDKIIESSKVVHITVEPRTPARRHREATGIMLIRIMGPKGTLVTS